MSKKILYFIFVLMLCTNFTLGQTLMSDEDHYNMMKDFSINLNSVLTENCPQGMTIDQFKKKVVNGELTLSSTAQASILTYAAPLKAYGSDFATAKGLTATTDAYKYFYSSFDPDTLVQNGKYIENRNTSVMTPVEMWSCALVNFNTNDCGLSALVSNKSNLDKLAATWLGTLTQQIGELGVILMINGFGDCMDVYLVPHIDFIPMVEVMDTDPDIAQSLSNLIDQTDPNEYVIDSTSVTRARSYTGRKSYTFTVLPKPEDTFFQNIIIDSEADGEVSKLLAEYELDNSNSQISNNDITPHIVNSYFEPLTGLSPTYGPIVQTVNSSRCITTKIIGTNYQYCAPLVDGTMDCKPENNNGPTILPAAYKLTAMSTITIITVDYFCLGMGTNPRPIGGGVNIYTQPKTPTTTFNFVSGLTGARKVWWDQATPKIKKRFGDYLNQHPSAIEYMNVMIDFEIEVDWEKEIKNALSSGITKSAELVHKIYSKLSVIASNYPSSISYINILIDEFRNITTNFIKTTPHNCNWTDLFYMWLFERGSNPIVFSGDTITTNSLKTQEGVIKAREMAINQIQNNNFTKVVYPWVYGKDEFWDGLQGGNIATSFLGSYTTTISILTLPSGQHMLSYNVSNTSSWESATRLRIDNDGDGAHDGIFPNHTRDEINTLHLGGNFKQKWNWTETID